MNKCERCQCMRVNPEGSCLACGHEHPDDHLFGDVKPPGIFRRSALTMHVAYSGPENDPAAHVAIRMAKGANLTLLQPAIEMAMAAFCKQHADGFEAAMEMLTQGAMHVAGHSTTRNAEEDGGKETDTAGE